MLTEKLQKQVEELWTVQDVCRFFDVTAMTIHLWRKKRSLPAVVLPGKSRPTIRFVPQDVRTWAEKNDVVIAS